MDSRQSLIGPPEVSAVVLERLMLYWKSSDNDFEIDKELARFYY